MEGEDILIQGGGVLPGGLSVIGYWALASDIAVWPALPINPASFEEASEMVGDFEMKPGKYFRAIESDLEMSELLSNSQGEMNYLSADNRYTFTQCGTSKQLIGMMNSTKNRNLAVLLTDLEGKVRQLGDQALPAKIVSFSELGGKKTADMKAVQFIVYAPGALALFYGGEVPIETPAIPPENVRVDESGNFRVDESGGYREYI
jgi:hypothetical protein